MELAIPMLSARGEVELTLLDVATGRVETIRSRNSLTPSGLNRLRNSRLNDKTPADSWSYGMVDSPLVSRFYLNGESGRSQTATRIGPDPSPPFPLSLKYRSVFAPGEGTGSVDYIMTTTNQNTSFFIYTLPQPITKGPNHELTVVWTCYLDIPQRVSQKLIPGGQRDGVTDVLVTTYVTDYMAQRFIYTPEGSVSYYSRGARPDSPETSVYYYQAGTSNAPSDIQNDTASLKGNRLGEIQGTGLTIRAGTSDWNGQIGEILVQQRVPYKTYDSTLVTYTTVPVCRFTFDPPLDKTNDYELELSWVYGSAVEVPPPS